MAGLRFNALIREAGIDPADVRLLRHETQKHGRTPYALWRDDPDRFNDYQRTQKRSRRKWFVGLFDAMPVGPVPEGWIDPVSSREASTLSDYELYALRPLDALADYSGRLVVNWGAGTRSWVQRAANQDKVIVELREQFIEPAFPGYHAFMSQLSDIEALPLGWRVALAAAQGVYLLTCPRTREQYVGAATGTDGFFGRWLNYVSSGDGGNIGLRLRDPADYRISILQVAGSADTRETILAMEGVWKAKLQSREMGLNRN